MRRTDRQLWALASCAVFFIVGCGASSEEPIGAVASPINRGNRDFDDPSSNSVVQIVLRVAGGAAQICTGTLVTPRLVLTAAHCVYSVVTDGMDPDDRCDDLRRAPIVDPAPAPGAPPGDFLVEVDFSRNRGVNLFEVESITLREDLGPAACTDGYAMRPGDLALLTLATEVPSALAIPQMPLIEGVFNTGWMLERWEARAHIMLVGYGATESGIPPGDPAAYELVRQQQRYGADAPRLLSNYRISQGETAGRPSIIVWDSEGGRNGVLGGDSGGPLFVGAQSLKTARFPRFQVGTATAAWSVDYQGDSIWVELGEPATRTWLRDQAEALEATLGSNRAGRWYDERDYSHLNAADLAHDSDQDRYYDWAGGVCPVTFFESTLDAGGWLPPALPDLASEPPALYAEEQLFINDRAQVYSASGQPVLLVAGNELRRLQDAATPRRCWVPPGAPSEAEAEIGLRGGDRHTYARIGTETRIDGTLLTTGGFLTVGPRSRLGDLWIPDTTDVYDGSLGYMLDPILWNHTVPAVPRLRFSRPFPSATVAASASYGPWAPHRPRLYELGPWWKHDVLPPNPDVVYDIIKVDNRQVVYLEPGVYFTNRLQVEPGGILALPCDSAYLATHGHCENVTLLVRDSVDVKSARQTITLRDELPHDEGAPPAAQSFLLGYFGTQEAFIHYLDVTVVAPNAKVTLFTANPPHRKRRHVGGVYAKSLEVHQDSQFEYVPFVCDPGE